jgi:hypothetical protein
MEAAHTIKRLRRVGAAALLTWRLCLLPCGQPWKASVSCRMRTPHLTTVRFASPCAKQTCCPCRAAACVLGLGLLPRLWLLLVLLVWLMLRALLAVPPLMVRLVELLLTALLTLVLVLLLLLLLLLHPLLLAALRAAAAAWCCGPAWMMTRT